MTKILCCTLLSIFLLIAIGVAEDQSDSVKSIDPTTVSDGPYVSWTEDGRLAVSRVCAGEHHDTTLQFTEKTALRDCCGLSPLKETYAYKPDDTVKAINSTNGAPIFVVSDIHGEYQALVNLLKNASVIDSLHNWSWGRGHLVFDGDIFDRGAQVTECLWLIYKLEDQAATAGGRVHLLLGNHELMVLRGDNRYIHDRYLEVTAAVIGKEHQDLFGPNTLFGDWLRTKNCIERLDNILFVHGGVSNQLAHTGMTIDEINAQARSFYDIPRDSAKTDTLASLLYGSYGPFWYRGLLVEMEKYSMATEAEVDSLLDYFGATAIVVGHSEMDSIMPYFNQKVFGVDVPVGDLGGFQALLIKDNRFYRVNVDGSETEF